MVELETIRVDKWVWAVRLYPSRSAATSAANAGHVRINDAAAKPSSTVKVGDRVEARIGNRLRIVEVVRIIEKRVGAPIAAECIVDHSPPPPSRDEPVFARDRGTGRPTKRERRDLDRLRGGL